MRNVRRAFGRSPVALRPQAAGSPVAPSPLETRPIRSSTLLAAAKICPASPLWGRASRRRIALADLHTKNDAAFLSKRRRRESFSVKTRCQICHPPRALSGG
jgi:hypothetical protein